MEIKKREEKENILQDLLLLEESFDRMLYILTYLKHIIYQVDDEKDIWELEFDIKDMLSLYGVDNDKFRRCKRDIDNIANKMESLDFSDKIDPELFLEISNRVINYAKKNKTS